jgi:hypothetical protein
MIKHIALATEPISAGELRIIRVEASEPIQLKIKCFVYKPPPGRFDGCPECGTFQIKSSEPFSIRASVDKFSAGGGAIVLSVRDGDGDEEEIRLEVANWDNPATGGRRYRPAAFTPSGSDTDLVPSGQEEPELAEH